MTKRILSLILSLVLLFSTTIPAFASDNLTDINEIVQDVEKTAEETEEKEIFDIEDDEPDVEEHEEEKDDVVDSGNDEADTGDSKEDEKVVEKAEDDNTVVEEPENDKADVEESEQGKGDEEEAPETSKDAADAPAVKLDMPKIFRLTNTPEGVHISWNAVPGAQNYRVLLLESSGEWKKLEDTAATSYLWNGAQEGVYYVFSVRCISSSGETFVSDFDETGMGIAYTVTEQEDEQSEGDEPEDDEIIDEGIEVKASDEDEADAEETEEGENAILSLDELGGVDEGESIATMALYPLGMPEILRLINTPEGVALSWTPVAGAAKYRVFYKYGTLDWMGLTDTDATSFTWTGAKAGYNYVFTVRCVSADGKSFTSDYNTAGKGITYTPAQLETPVLSTEAQGGIKSTPEGILLTWGAVLGAQRYRVFYRPEGTNTWIALGDTTDTSYTWAGAKVNNLYNFTVRCYSSDGSYPTSDYDAAGVSIIYKAVLYDTPKLNDPVVTSENIVISWGAVSGAKKYRVFYKTKSTNWTGLIDTTATSYTWSGAKKDETYSFTVRCLSADSTIYTSDYDAVGKTITYGTVLLDTPQLISVINAPNGIVVSWDAVPNAKKYRVFYKTASSDWMMAGDTTETSYTWTSAARGTNYTFTVRCLSSDSSAYTSNYNVAGMSITYVPSQLATPEMTAVENTSNGVAISWKPVPGAAKYYVFYKTDSGSWTGIAQTASPGYIWTGAKENVRYTFTVRCYASDGSVASGYDSTGLSIIYKPSESQASGYILPTPRLLSAVSAPNGVKISWDAVTGAEKYTVFYRIGTGAWVGLVNTSATEYTWTGAKAGTAYTFTVRCLSSDGVTPTSSYDGVGVSCNFNPPKSLQAPVIKTLQNTPNGVSISWDAVPGAQKYRVFYKYDGINWTGITDTTSTNYTWNGARNGIKYTFTVRCLSADGTSYISDYNATGVSIVYTPMQLATPGNLYAASNTAQPNHVKISWGAVAGAEKYRVFYKTGAGSWTKLIDTTSTEYTWTEAECSMTYQFTVRCISADGNSYTSNYDTRGVEVSISKLTMSEVQYRIVDNGVELYWDKVPGAYKYRVFYKTNDMNWAMITDTTENRYTWADVRPGTTYTFTVRCVSYDGTAYTSDYNVYGVEVAVPLLATPELTSVANVSGGVEITWNAVPGAQKYLVFYKIGSGAWTGLAFVTSTSYTWRGAKPNTTYAFTVRCMTADGSAATSSYDSVGLTITTFDETLAKIIANGNYRQSDARAMLPKINNMRTTNAWYWNSDNRTTTQVSNLGLLAYDSSLEQIAMQRAAELNMQFSNNRPDGSSFSSLVYNGVRSSCEIILQNNASVNAVFDALVAADGYYNEQRNRRKLLGSYNFIGIACFEYNGTVHWVVELR